MKLFIAQMLIDCEPGYIAGVFDSREEAIKAALTLPGDIPAITEVQLNKAYNFDDLVEELLDQKPNTNVPTLSNSKNTKGE